MARHRIKYITAIIFSMFFLASNAQSLNNDFAVLGGMSKHRSNNIIGVNGSIMLGFAYFSYDHFEKTKDQLLDIRLRRYSIGCNFEIEGRNEDFILTPFVSYIDNNKWNNNGFIRERESNTTYSPGLLISVKSRAMICGFSLSPQMIGVTIGLTTNK